MIALQRPCLRKAGWTGSLLTAVVVLMVGGGCEPQTGQVLQAVQKERDRLAKEKGSLEQTVIQREQDIQRLEEQIEHLRGFGPDWLAALFVVDRLELASLTGGADYDGCSGDDGVTIYLRPIDADGHFLKAAGEIVVDLIDASQPGAPRSLGSYVHNEPSQLRKLWHGGFLTNHYTIKCPWSPGMGPPRQPEVLVQVTFLDFLTGRRFTTSKMVEVQLPIRAR